MYCPNMTINMFKILIISSLFLILLSCKENKKEQPTIPHWTQEKSTKINKEFTKEEELRIRLYLKHRKDWKVTKTGTGLRYWIYDNHDGPTANEGDQVQVKFDIQLLDGTAVYKTEDNDLSTFKVDHADVESGIMEGIKYLSVGDKAKFILPSHIGHGLLGDFHKIPPLEVLVVDIQLVKIL